jgi:hypothetical protein
MICLLYIYKLFDQGFGHQKKMSPGRYVNKHSLCFLLIDVNLAANKHHTLIKSVRRY